MVEFPFTVARALLESRVRNILLLCLWLGGASWVTVKTPQAEFAAESMAQVGVSEVIFPHGQVAVLFTDIQEIKLNPKTA